jgi:methylmalonyl-CoA mutase cobalamin-binding domain/chain
MYGDGVVEFRMPNSPLQNSAAAALIKAAIEEDTDVLAVSCLSGALLTIAEGVLSLKTKFELTAMRFVLGGTIPERDKQILRDLGVDLVISTGDASIDEIVQRITQIIHCEKPTLFQALQ